MADINIEGNIVNYKEVLEGIEMKALQYRVEPDESGYCVTCSKGTIAVFSEMEDAIEAMRKFEQKRLPESWNRIPPAMRKAIEQYSELPA